MKWKKKKIIHSSYIGWHASLCLLQQPSTWRRTCEYNVKETTTSQMTRRNICFDASLLLAFFFGNSRSSCGLVYLWLKPNRMVNLSTFGMCVCFSRTICWCLFIVLTVVLSQLLCSNSWICWSELNLGLGGKNMVGLFGVLEGKSPFITFLICYQWLISDWVFPEGFFRNFLFSQINQNSIYNLIKNFTVNCFNSIGKIIISSLVQFY